jgi:hypothetical protein
MTSFYRDDAAAARLRRDSLLRERREEISRLPGAPAAVYARRASRIAAGAVGCAAAVLLALFWSPDPSFYGDALFSALVAAGVAALLGRYAGRVLFAGALSRVFRATDDPSADVDRLERLKPAEVAAGAVAALARWGAAAPLAALALLAPRLLSISWLFLYRGAFFDPYEEVTPRFVFGGASAVESLVILVELTAGLAPALLAWRFSCKLTAGDVEEVRPAREAAKGAALIAVLELVLRPLALFALSPGYWDGGGVEIALALVASFSTFVSAFVCLLVGFAVAKVWQRGDERRLAAR